MQNESRVISVLYQYIILKNKCIIYLDNVICNILPGINMIIHMAIFLLGHFNLICMIVFTIRTKWPIPLAVCFHNLSNSKEHITYDFIIYFCVYIYTHIYALCVYIYKFLKHTYLEKYKLLS